MRQKDRRRTWCKMQRDVTDPKIKKSWLLVFSSLQLTFHASSSTRQQKTQISPTLLPIPCPRKEHEIRKRIENQQSSVIEQATMSIDRFLPWTAARWEFNDTIRGSNSKKKESLIMKCRRERQGSDKQTKSRDEDKQIESVAVRDFESLHWTPTVARQIQWSRSFRSTPFRNTTSPPKYYTPARRFRAPQIKSVEVRQRAIEKAEREKIGARGCWFWFYAAVGRY